MGPHVYQRPRRLKLQGQKQQKNQEKGRFRNTSNDNFFDGYVQHVVNPCHEISTVVEMTQPMGPLPEILVLCPFFALGLVHRRKLVSH